MNQTWDGTAYGGEIAAHAEVDARAAFLRKTYGHLVLAVGAFVLATTVVVQSGLAEACLGLLSQYRFGWLLALGAFMVVSNLADRWARSGGSPGRAYLGLGVYVAAQAVLFGPLLFVANQYAGESVILPAAVTTGAVFTALTAVVFVTGKDFSFLGSVLRFGGIAAIGLIVASFFLPMTLGTWFVVGMVAFAGVSVLYYTSNVLHHYRTDQYVAASLALFASIALLFWYILQLFLNRD